MSRALKSLDTPIRDSLANFDKARFTRILDANLSYSLLVFMEEVANQGSSANGTAALFALLKPDYAPSVSPDQLIRIYNDNGDKVTALLCSPATPNFISVAQLKVTSFINNLHPTRDRLFLDWFNSIYPSGKTDEFAAITHRWLLGRKSLSPDQLLAEDTEASTFAQTKFDVDSHAFISKLGARTSGSDQLIAAIKAHPTLRPAIAKAFAATTTATKATSPAVVQHDSAPATQPTRICTTIDKLIGCGIAFIPASNRYKFCNSCHTKHLAQFPDLYKARAFVASQPTLASAPIPTSLIATTYPAYWDNADSLNVTPDANLLFDLVQLDAPIAVGGIGSSVLATATGFFSCLPPGYNLGYLTPASTSTLLSLGSLARSGGSYSGDSTGLRVYQGTGPTASALDTSPLLPNQLSAVSPAFLATHRSFSTQPNPKPTFNQSQFVNECNLFHANPLTHFTPEDRLRAAAIADLHAVYVHGSDSALATALDSGSIITPLRLTSRDVAVYRVLVINCDPCIAAKLHNPSYPPSTNQPAVSIGSVVSFDLEELPVPSMPGGHTHLLLAVEEKTGTIAAIPCKNKSAPVVFATAMQYLDTYWKAHGHATTNTTSDPESVFRSLIPLFGHAGITHTLMPPGQHAQRLERHEQELINKETAVRASLPFYFPQSLDAHVKSAVAFSMSLLPNSSTTPATPYELRTNHRFAQHAQHAHITIGTVCNVMEGEPSRVRKSKLNGQRIQVQPVAELGVCLGFCPSTPGSYNFLVGSGRIVARRAFSIINVLPFNWERRKLFPATSLLPAQLPTRASPPPLQPAAPASPIIAPPLQPTPASTCAPTAASAEPTVARILSYTGEPKRPRSLEFLVQYTDGAERYHWKHELDELPAYQTFTRDLPAFQSAPTRVAQPSAAGNRRSARITPPPPTPVAHLAAADPLAWTLVLPRNRKGRLTPPPISQPATQLRRTSKAQLPLALDCAVHDDPLSSLALPPRSRPPASTPVALDDLAWYTPRTTAESTAQATQDLPWELDPEPTPEIPSCNFEQACKLYPEPTMAAFNTEMNKYFVDYSVCDLNKPVRFADIPATALKQYQSILVQPRFHASGLLKKISVRCVTQGQHQPAHTYTSLYAGTCATSSKLAMFAAYHAHAKQHQLPLTLFAGDVPGAFLQGHLTADNSPVDCFIKFPANIPHVCAGKWFQRHRGTYGAKNSNAIFDADLVTTLVATGFYPNPEDAKLFTKIHPDNPLLSCTVSTHVDDEAGCSTYPPFVAELKAALEARYGTLEWHSEAVEITGFSLRRYTDGSMDVGMTGHINRMLTALGATNLPYRATPSDADLFAAPTDTTPVDVSNYRHLIGNISYIAPVLPRCKKEIQYLATRQAQPTQSDLTKVIKLLAYIYHHQDEAAVRFSGTDTQVYVHADASYSAHPDGRSHTGYYISIGATSGAIRCYSAKQTHCVADGSMHAEYVVLAQAAKDGIHFRRLLHAMGFPQHQPVTILEDNESAINLAEAPAVTRNSQHIHVRYHLIRDFIQNKSVQIAYVATEDQPADLLTKTLSPTLTKAFGDRIHNVSQTPLTILPSQQSDQGVGGCVRGSSTSPRA